MVLRKLLPVLLLLFGAVSGTSLWAQWSTYTPMPATRWAHVCAEANGKLYVAGGSTAPTWEYDPVGGTWTVRASIPTLRSYPGIASWNGKIYVLGGSVGAAWSAKNEMYDPVTNTWTTLADMPSVRTTTAAAAVNGKIYVMNGWNGSAMSAVDVYDIASNTWSSGVAAPTGRSHAKTAVINDRIYLVGGYNGGYLSTLEVFDPGLNTWSTLIPMPTARYIHAVGAVGNYVFVAGGYAGGASNSFQSYDVNSGNWSVEANLPTARYRVDGAAANGCFYVLGGYNGSNLSVNEGFCPVILPVDVRLDGRKRDDRVVLTWQDAGAGTVSHYQLERSGTDRNFTEIGRVEAALSKTGEFAFSDWEPRPGINLYRLKRVDRNGKSDHSAAIEVAFDESDGFTWKWDARNAMLTIQSGSEDFSAGSVLEIFDITGRMLAREHSSGGSEFNLHFDRPSGGVVLVKISGGNRSMSKLIFLEETRMEDVGWRM